MPPVGAPTEPKPSLADLTKVIKEEIREELNKAIYSQPTRDFYGTGKIAGYKQAFNNGWAATTSSSVTGGYVFTTNNTSSPTNTW